LLLLGLLFSNSLLVLVSTLIVTQYFSYCVKRKIKHVCIGNLGTCSLSENGLSFVCACVVVDPNLNVLEREDLAIRFQDNLYKKDR
jgi:hypothetical protein